MLHRVRSRALPARFRRHRLLIVGCGDVGMRLVRSLQPVPRRVQVLALNSTPERSEALRAAGIRVLAGNLDEPATLRRLAGLAHSLVHLAPPGTASPATDPRTRALIAALRRGACHSAWSMAAPAACTVTGKAGGRMRLPSRHP